MISADGLNGSIADMNTPPSLDGMEQSVVNYYDPEFLKAGIGNFFRRVQHGGDHAGAAHVE